MSAIIEVQNLGKQYRIGRAEPYRTLRESLVGLMKSPLQKLRESGGDDSQSTFWALKDVSFDVDPGEVVGIIGRNGAGKSTLLKILSRITKPSTGRITLGGRVGSLLEVGTGFHPELSGRENIYLNGAILGMHRAEIRAKFDEIVAFSEIEQFLDTPVKRYSSGMYMRLAFAVAAHLEPEILIVDEVLAVGDAAFQKKCLNKMGSIARTGRSVLFVSHNIPAVTRLCDRCILLRDGRIERDGSPQDVVSSYLRSGLGTSAARAWGPDVAPGDATVRLREVRARTENGSITETFDIRRPIAIDIVYEVLSEGTVLYPNVHFFNEDGVMLFIAIDNDPTWHRTPRPVDTYQSTVWVPGNMLAEGTVSIAVAITTFIPMHVHLEERDVIAFQIVDVTSGDSARGDYSGPLPGVVRPMLQWETRVGSGCAPVEQQLDPSILDKGPEIGNS